MHGINIARIGMSEAGRRIAAAGYAHQAEQARAVAAERGVRLDQARAAEEHRAPDTGWACRMLAHWSVLQPRVVITAFIPPWRRIVGEVCDKHGVTFDALTSRVRTAALTVPRFEAYYRLYRETPLSMQEIGRRLDRDHSSVHHGIRRHAERHGLPMSCVEHRDGEPS